MPVPEPTREEIHAAVNAWASEWGKDETNDFMAMSAALEAAAWVRWKAAKAAANVTLAHALPPL